MIPDSFSPPSVQITKDGSPTLFSERYQQTYHSKHGSLTESNHIFLEATGVRNRLQAGDSTRVLEVGLGTGLNFLLTAREALVSGTGLEYWAFEHTIISTATFASLKLDTCIQDTGLLDAFSEVLRALADAADDHMHSFAIRPSIQLHVLKGDALNVDLPDARYHAVYQDAFSPDVNPELWSSLFFQRIYATMHPGGRLTTFSVRRLVRDTLTAAGFQVQKRQGPPGGKRQMLLAIKPDYER